MTNVSFPNLSKEKERKKEKETFLILILFLVKKAQVEYLGLG
jgi:hypothetical protein